MSNPQWLDIGGGMKFNMALPWAQKPSFLSNPVIIAAQQRQAQKQAAEAAARAQAQANARANALRIQYQAQANQLRSRSNAALSSLRILGAGATPAAAGARTTRGSKRGKKKKQSSVASLRIGTTGSSTGSGTNLAI